MRRYLKSILLLTLTMVATPVASEIADPTRPPVMSSLAPRPVLPKQQGEWVLTMVKLSSSRRTAVLNGKVVHVGDEVGAATVAAILPTAVLLQENRRRFEVRLNPGSVKTAVGKARETKKPAQGVGEVK